MEKLQLTDEQKQRLWNMLMLYLPETPAAPAPAPATKPKKTNIFKMLCKNL